jgi:hypothetical protein
VIRITFRLPYFDWVKKEPPPRIWGRASASEANRLNSFATGPRREPRVRRSGNGYLDYKLVESESDQARAKQDKACNGHSEEASRSEFIPHGTPPVMCPGAEENDRPVAQSKNILSDS